MARRSAPGLKAAALPAPDLFAEGDAFGLPTVTAPVPDEVLAGLGKLAGAPPLWGTPTDWRELFDRLRAWTCRWHGPATAAGWGEVALYGLSPDAPQVRRDLMGGAWLANLSGHQTVAVDRDAIRLVARTAARLSVYRPEAGGMLGWLLRRP
jgi:hypothetical protein